ncbi:MAG: SDR family oxidoreductase [Alicyclobacillaceae bacterium]|nr:SDR family oxidoreductase [Alicyclobacillaceae bacterium]
MYITFWFGGFDVDGPVALVTGTSSGFGLWTSVALAREGYQVVATMRDLGKKDRLLEEARRAGVEERIECTEMDVTDGEAIARTVGDVIARFGSVDVLVNNAGFAVGGFVEEVSMEAWRRQFETNVFGLVAVTKAVLPHMRERRRGVIVNIGSISGRIGLPGLAPYSASKFAVEGFSESLRLEMQPFGVRVVLIEPGAFKTDIWQKGLGEIPGAPDSPYASLREAMLREVRRTVEAAGNPKEVARLVVEAVRTPRPRLRYPVGKGVRTMLTLKTLVPWGWLERLAVARIGRG